MDNGPDQLSLDLQGLFLSVWAHILTKCPLPYYTDNIVKDMINLVYYFISYLSYLLHGMCLYQVMMTLHFLNDVVDDIESTQKSVNMSSLV